MIHHILENDIIKTENHDMLCITIFPKSLCRVFTILRDQFNFLQLTDITAIDYPKHEIRFIVVYHLLNHQENTRIRIKIAVQDEVQSLVPIYKMANWYEREIFDLFGISFKEHPRLERILTDYGFEGYPLRKDFPVYGYTQVRHDGKNVIKEPVLLKQPYREFDFISPWEDLSNPTLKPSKREDC